MKEFNVKLILEISDKQIHLTKEEMKELRDVISSIIGKDTEKEYIPYKEYIYPYCTYPYIPNRPYWYYDSPRWTTTCESITASGGTGGRTVTYSTSLKGDSNSQKAK